MHNIFSVFFVFLKKPFFIRKPITKISLEIIVVLFLASLPLTFPLGLIDQIKWIKMYFGIVQDNQLNDILTHSFIYGIITASLIAPMLEEYIFRYYLSSFYGNVAFIFINFFIVIYNIFLLHHKNALVLAVILLVIALTCFFILDANKKIRYKAFRLMHAHFRFVFYLSAFAFGALHLSNYDFDKHIIILPIFLVLAQIVAGVFLGYIRLNYGIRFSIIFHAFNNLLFTIILFL